MRASLQPFHHQHHRRCMWDQHTDDGDGHKFDS